jgi:L-lactate dehydrogenase complex protein LldG
MLKGISISMEQQAFIGRIRSALGRASTTAPNAADLCTSRFSAEQREILERIQNRSQTQRLRLLERLKEMAAPIHLNIIPVEDASQAAAAIADLVRHKKPEWGEQKCVATWKHPLVERLQLADVLSGQQVPVYVIDSNDRQLEGLSAAQARQQLRTRVIASYIGVTAADYCMADTATLVLRTRPGQARSVSLVPSIHIGVIHIEQIIADLKELYALLLWDPEERKEGLTNCMTFISGPSKTADVEQTLTLGAHGPKRFIVLLRLNAAKN